MPIADAFDGVGEVSLHVAEAGFLCAFTNSMEVVEFRLGNYSAEPFEACHPDAIELVRMALREIDAKRRIGAEAVDSHAGQVSQ